MSTQPDLLLGLELKEQGQAQVAEHNPDFMGEMRSAAIRIARQKGTITSDDLRAYAELHGLKAPNPNCWGAIFLGNHWRTVGHTRSTVASNHARTIRVWALNIA